ncbi:hypothetical protein HZS93_07044 (plasmid) [Xanthomonas citri]|uniref:hypothetical protein n=2 Tax=Xanthomonas TaxID=338 RepID=UPI001C759EDF|nr:hypothetical protein HZS93_07044 [Xanthomonas citri]
MLLLGHESIEDVRTSALELQRMGPAAQRLLSECVEHQGCTRIAMSKPAQALEDSGFVFIRESGFLSVEKVHISPSLAGEEALAYFEDELAKLG